MPEEATTDTTETATEKAATTTETQTEEAPDPAAEVEKWKSLARKNEQRAKDNAEKAKRLDEIEESNKTELQKLAERAEAAEKEANELRADKERAVVRAEVAKAKGVPESVLRGSTREDFEAHADELLSTFTTKAGTDTQGQGNVGKPISKGAQPDLNDLLRAAARK